jgi:hypothetical protein
MQAIFRFNGSEEIEVSTTGSDVLVLQRTLRKPGSIVSTEQTANIMTAIERESVLAFTKSQARSVASAMMQAAAEL